MQYYKYIETLRDKYWGAQDVYRNEETIDVDKKQDNIQLQYVKTIQLKPTLTKEQITTILQKKKGLRLTFGDFNYYDSSHVINNARVSSNKNILYYELEIGGQRMDKVYGRVLKTIRHLYKIKDSNVIPFSFCRDRKYLPFTKYYQIRFCIEFDEYDIEEDFTLSVDVYQMINRDPELPWEIITTQLYYTGEKRATDRSVLYRIHFNHPCTYLIANFPDNDIEKLHIYFDGEKSKINLTHSYKYDNHYIIPLTKSLEMKDIVKYGINLSGVRSMFIHIELEKELINGTGHIYAINWQPLRIMSGMAGLAFSK